MRKRNRNGRKPAADNPQGLLRQKLLQDRFLREEIEGDVFELWLGISRLMARVHGTQHGLQHGSTQPSQNFAARAEESAAE